MCDATVISNCILNTSLVENAKHVGGVNAMWNMCFII